jgi:hypothetical protein
LSGAKEMKEQEKKDLEIMLAKMQEIKVKCFDYLKSLNRLNRNQLDMAGYKGKSNAEAMQMSFKRCENEIEQVQKEYVRKYPD